MRVREKGRIEIQNESFIVNGEERFIFGGEVHYFRIPRQEWRDRVRKVKEAGGNLISTYIPWLWHEPVEGEIDLAGRLSPERDLATFLETIAEEEMVALVRPGPYVMSELVGHGLPTWLLDRYPEIIAKTEEGEPHPTRVVTYLHPQYLSHVKRWYEAVCSVIAPRQIDQGGPVILFQLDNEVGMLQWVTNQGDYNDQLLDDFVADLRVRYTFTELNERMGTDFPSFESIKEQIKKRVNEIAPLEREYLLFLRRYYMKYLETLQQMARQNGITTPFIVNIHGFDMVDYAKRGIRYPIGLSQLYETSKMENTVLAGDYYIGNIVHDNYTDIVLANAFTKAVQSEEQPLFSAEFQGGFQMGKPRLQPTTFDLTTRLCIANGMNAVNYYMFAGGENYEGIGLMGRRHDWQAPVSTDGSLKPHYHVIRDLSRVIGAIEKELLASKKEVVTYLGFYQDYFMTEHIRNATREMFETFTRFRESFLFNGIGRGLVLNNIAFEGYDLLKEVRIDPTKIPSLWVLSTPWMEASLQEKLIRYVEEGGQLVLFPSLPLMDMNGRPCRILADALGVKRVTTLHYPFAEIDGMDSIQAPYLEIYQGEDLVGFAGLEREEEGDGNVSAFEKDIGKGKIILFGIGLEMDQTYKEELVGRLARRLGLRPSSLTSDYLDVSFRKIPHSKTTFLFLHNFDEYAKEMVLDHFGETLFDGRPLRIEPRSGLILPLHLLLTEGREIIYSTAELIHRDAQEVAFYLRQPIEAIKWSEKVTLLNDEIEHEWRREGGEYLFILKNGAKQIARFSLDR